MTAPLSGDELAVLRALRGLRFGAVEAVVHEGRIVRIERTEKLRLGLDSDMGEPAADHPSSRAPRPDRRSQERPPTGDAP